jgi:transcriptional regulator with XRE-family HTH domain
LYSSIDTPTIVSVLAPFAANLRRARLRSGMTQESLAHKCGLHPTHISLLELSKRNPKLTTLVRLADGLDMTLAKLLRGVQKSKGVVRPRK